MKKKNIGIGTGLAVGTAALIYVSSGVGGAVTIGLWTAWVVLGTWLVAYATREEE